jgi:glycyl-tRNA synthetase beta chain
MLRRMARQSHGAGALMPQLLLELFSEEIPARMQVRAAEDLTRLMTEAFKEAGVTPGTAKAFVTPRRLAVVFEELPAKTEDVSEELKGPRVSAPAAALDGFLKKTGLTKEQLIVQADPKGDFYLAKIERPGRATAEVIAEAVPRIVRAFPWPKSQRWGSGSLRWVRPLRSILCLFDGAVVPFEVDGIVSGATTRGHRLMADASFAVTGYTEYREKLRAAYVLLDAEDRKAEIVRQARAAAEREGLVFKDDPDLLDEVAGLVEWPVALVGRFDPAFLDVPAEVLVSTMRKNQKYFALYQADGRLAPAFVVIANLAASDGGTAIVTGNERVVRARLSDAKFFWDQDLKTTLEARLPQLKEIVFHAKLGTQFERVERITRLAAEIAEKIGADVEKTRIAARLCKADLVSGTVGEFPEVQGTIGGYLARAEGLDPEIAEAIADHYRPAGPSDRVPSGKIAAAVALADKLDTLIGFFAIDEKPTGSKDPYALRRAAIGVARTLLEQQLRLELGELLIMHTAAWLPALRLGARAFDVAKTVGELFRLGLGREAEKVLKRFERQAVELEKDDRAVRMAIEIALEVNEYVLTRGLVAHLGQGGTNNGIVAVLSAELSTDVVLIVHRMEALDRFLKTEDGKTLLAGYKRAANILRIEEKKDKRQFDGSPDPSLMTEEPEVELFKAIAIANDLVAAELDRERFDEAMAVMARLRGPVDAFFTSVTVNAAEPEVRENRLRLLKSIVTTAHRVADFSKIEG